MGSAAEVGESATAHALTHQEMIPLLQLRFYLQFNVNSFPRQHGLSIRDLALWHMGL